MDKEARALAEKAKKEAEEKVSAVQATPEVSQSVESVTETATKLESTPDVVKVESVQ